MPYKLHIPLVKAPNGSFSPMPKPSVENFVEYDMEGKKYPCGSIPIFEIRGIYTEVEIENETKPAIHLWRYYNKFDEVPTIIPKTFEKITYDKADCDECLEFKKMCDECTKFRPKRLERGFFGKRILAKDYIPIPINHPGFETLFIKVNMGEPFKVYYKLGEKNQIYIYRRREDLIDCYSLEDYTKTNYIRERSSADESENDDFCDDSDQENEISDREIVDYSEDERFYDDLVYSGQPEKIFIPQGHCDNHFMGTIIVPEFKGNTLLLFNGEIKPNVYNYVMIRENIASFDLPEKINTYYSIICNSRTPYPICVGEKNVYMIDVGHTPLEYFKDFTECQIIKACNYFYGHICYKCHDIFCARKNNDKCCTPMPYEKNNINYKVLATGF